jgi:formate-dependent nitrite reductase cytochrome c552 subunit
MRTRIAATVMAASLLTGAGAGALLFTPSGASAVDTTTTGPAAAADGERDGWAADALQKLVDDGTLTRAQADKVLSALRAARPEHGPGRRGRPFHAPGVVAGAIGISVDQLRTELEAGKSLADVAAAHGVDEQKVIDAIVQEAKTHLAAAVATGRITQAQADQRLADLQSHVKDMVEHVRPAGPPPAEPAA